MSFFSMYITVLYCDIAINKFHLKWSSLEARRAHNFVVIFCENRNLVKGSNPFPATLKGHMRCPFLVCILQFYIVI